ncbi:MAG: dihydrodipicolinate synthase family protein [Candidatus Sumerlaeota bacterium]
MLPENAPRGNWATLLLPIRGDDSIDEDALRREIDLFEEWQVDGVYSNGTAGEFYNQTEEEFRRVQTLLAARCHHHGLPFQIGISHPFPVVTLARAQECAELEPSAFQLILPDWFPPKLPEIIDYLKRIAVAADRIPLVLYNPPHAKVRLSPDELLIVANEIPELIGVKVPAGDEQWYDAMQPVFDCLSVFVPGHTLATGYSRGAHGAYSNVACIHPGAAQRWWELISSRDPAGMEWEQRIQRFMREAVHPYIAEQGYANQAVDKLMAAAGGWGPVTSRLRWPYRWLGEDQVAVTRRALEVILPEFIQPAKQWQRI